MLLSKKLDIKNGCLVKYGGAEEHVVIPDSVTSIGNEAFKGSKVKKGTIPNSCKEIGNSAFEAPASQRTTKQELAR